ncbi:MAG: nuclear transport factor 2 family protein [Candidatus Heimdallarchaeota archaeon]|nr:nuclear transport factor 2 family protein [Candidatus Heimdallarchaeota archaeon]
MSAELHKEIIIQFYDCQNQKDWETLETLVHEDYDEQYAIKNEDFKEIKTSDAIFSESASSNPFFQFLKLLGFSDEKIAEGVSLWSSISGKESFIKEMIWSSDIFTETEITHLIGDDNQVWVRFNAIINEPKKRNIVVRLNEIFTFKDSKIIHHHGWGHYYAALLQYGKIVLAQNEELEMERYLNTLQEMGLIPSRHV